MIINVAKVTSFYIKYKLVDEDDTYIAFFDTAEEMFYNASKIVAFSDIEPIYIKEVSYCDRACHFAGWHPGMRIIFKDDITGQTVWDESYPEWDH